jgi:hypothetical protein
MTIRRRPASQRTSSRALRSQPLRLVLAALLGLAAALLVSCGSSGKGLIPASKSGPLQSDFEAVRDAAEQGNGDCGATEAALLKTAEDFSALPASVDANLHNTLRQGIDNLRSRALTLCAQTSTQTNTDTTPKTTTSTTTTTPTVTQTTPTTPSEPSEPTETPNNGGGTAAPGTEAPAGEQGATELGESRSGGASGEAGGAAPGGGAEGGK